MPEMVGFQEQGRAGGRVPSLRGGKADFGGEGKMFMNSGASLDRFVSQSGFAGFEQNKETFGCRPRGGVPGAHVHEGFRGCAVPPAGLPQSTMPAKAAKPKAAKPKAVKKAKKAPKAKKPKAKKAAKKGGKKAAAPAPATA